MKKLSAITAGTKSIATPAGLTIIAVLAVGFWFSTSPNGQAQDTPNMCVVCHKRTQTIPFPCDSLDYRRHLDHGDPMTACAVTPTQNP